jgi:putative flippase GtrA
MENDNKETEVKKDSFVKKVIKKFFTKEIILYLVFGVLSTVVNLGVKLGLIKTVLDEHNPFQLQVAIFIAWFVAVIFAYVTNRIFVFESKEKNKFKEFIKFFVGRIATWLFDAGFMFIFVTLINWPTDIMAIVSNVFVIIFNYILSKLFVFKKDKETK